MGAYVLTTLSGEAIAPFITAYLPLMGAYIVWRAYRSAPATKDEPPRWIAPLGPGGGFLDAIGHGTTLRFTIGSVNSAKFFVTAAISVTFLGASGLELWPIIAGLILGGTLAAPIAAYAAKTIPDRLLMTLVDSMTVLLSTRGLIRAMG